MQRDDFQRLGNGILHARLATAFGAPVVPARRERDDRELVGPDPGGADPSRGLEPVDVGQGQIHQHKGIRIVAGARLENEIDRLGAVGGNLGVAACLDQRGTHQQLIDLLVFRDEDERIEKQRGIARSSGGGHDANLSTRAGL